MKILKLLAFLLIPLFSFAQFGQGNKTFVRDTALLTAVRNLSNLIDTCSITEAENAEITAIEVTYFDRAQDLFGGTFDNGSVYSGEGNIFLNDNVTWDITPPIIPPNDAYENSILFEVGAQLAPPCPITDIKSVTFNLKGNFINSRGFALAAYIDDTVSLSNGQPYTIYNLSGSQVISYSLDVMPTYAALANRTELVLIWDEQQEMNLDYVWVDIAYTTECWANSEYLSLPVTINQVCNKAVNIACADTLQVYQVNPPTFPNTYLSATYCDVNTNFLIVEWAATVVTNSLTLNFNCTSANDNISNIFIAWGNGTTTSGTNPVSFSNAYAVAGNYLLEVNIETKSRAQVRYQIPIIYDGITVIVPPYAVNHKDEHVYKFAQQANLFALYSTTGDLLELNDSNGNPYALMGELWINCPDIYQYNTKLAANLGTGTVEIREVTSAQPYTVAAYTAKKITYSLQAGTTGFVNSGTGAIAIPNTRVFDIETNTDNYISTPIAFTSTGAAVVFLQIIR